MWRVLIALAWLAAAAAASAQGASPRFPALTGRVVDEANLLSPADRAALEAKLKAHEDKTTDQVVVATVRSLDGLPAEDYANRLFRAWKLGQQGKNNGALLLVAPAERKVRIEVGYGLEGALTDALTKVIITTAIAPKFKQNDFPGGINAGVDAMLSILTGDAQEWQRRAEVRHDEAGALDPVLLVFGFLLLIVIINVLMRGGGPRRPHRTRGGRWIVVPTPIPGGWGGGYGGGFGGGWSGGGGGDSFSGGGGSSGGGGASGDW